MWNETKSEIDLSDFNQKENSGPSSILPALIESVEPQSIGEDLGLQPGDKLISINGEKPRDLIDYRILICDEELKIEILDIKGQKHLISIEKEIDE